MVSQPLRIKYEKDIYFEDYHRNSLFPESISSVHAKALALSYVFIDFKYPNDTSAHLRNERQTACENGQYAQIKILICFNGHICGKSDGKDLCSWCLCFGEYFYQFSWCLTVETYLQKSQQRQSH